MQVSLHTTAKQTKLIQGDAGGKDGTARRTLRKHINNKRRLLDTTAGNPSRQGVYKAHHQSGFRIGFNPESSLT